MSGVLGNFFDLIFMKPLFERKIGMKIVSKLFFIASAGSYPGMYASWPLAKIQMYQEELVISFLHKKVVLPYRDIDYLEQKWFQVEIHHHAEGVDPYVYISGISFAGSFYAAIKNTVAQHGLSLVCR